MSKPTGGPAFPVLDVDENKQPYNLYPGMTLRDYFAANALQVWLPIWNIERDFNLCERAYRTADNMLKAREHEQSS